MGYMDFLAFWCGRGQGVNHGSSTASRILYSTLNFAAGYTLEVYRCRIMGRVEEIHGEDNSICHRGSMFHVLLPLC